MQRDKFDSRTVQLLSLPVCLVDNRTVQGWKVVEEKDNRKADKC